jgi:hypothetical protein
MIGFALGVPRAELTSAGPNKHATPPIARQMLEPIMTWRVFNI